MESVEFFCSGRENLTSVTPENHILFALSLTSDMKVLARTRMREINKDYMKNEKKYEAEGGKLCDLQHQLRLGLK